MKINKRKAGRGGKFTSAVMPVPVEIANLIPDEQEFSIELTDEGLLYRPVAQQTAKLPTWIKPVEAERAE